MCLRIFRNYGRDNVRMRKCDKWNKLQNKSGKVVLRHKLFGEQQYGCEALQVINDNEKIGVVVKGNELFVYKDKAALSISRNVYVVADDLLELKVIVNKV